MSTQVTINSLTGTSPYDVYVCDSNVLNCVYIATISSTPYVFNVPPPLDAQSEICVKVVDINGCEIIQCGTIIPNVTPSPTVTPTPTVTIGLTPTATETQTPTPTPTVTIGLTPTATETQTPTPTRTPTVTPTVTTTVTKTPTNTPTVTTTQTQTPTPTRTPTVTPTVTTTVTKTPTNTPTVTTTPTQSGTPNVTPTNTPTPSPYTGMLIQSCVDPGQFYIISYGSANIGDFITVRLVPGGPAVGGCFEVISLITGLITRIVHTVYTDCTCT
jgi:hypothetical protein